MTNLRPSIEQEFLERLRDLKARHARRRATRDVEDILDTLDWKFPKWPTIVDWQTNGWLDGEAEGYAMRFGPRAYTDEQLAHIRQATAERDAPVAAPIPVEDTVAPMTWLEDGVEVGER